jgi:hypothetical protein
VEQEYGEGGDAYGSIKSEQEAADEDAVSEGNTSYHNGRVGLTQNVDVLDYKTRILDNLSLCCSRTLVCLVCDPYAHVS